MAIHMIKSKERELMADLLPIVARLQCQKMMEVSGSVIYAVQSAWQKDLLLADSDCIEASTPTEFEAAVQSLEITSIFVPAYSLTTEILQRILSRNGLTKTVFWEV